MGKRKFLIEMAAQVGTSGPFRLWLELEAPTEEEAEQLAKSLLEGSRGYVVSEWLTLPVDPGSAQVIVVSAAPVNMSEEAALKAAVQETAEDNTSPFRGLFKTPEDSCL